MVHVNHSFRYLPGSKSLKLDHAASVTINSSTTNRAAENDPQGDLLERLNSASGPIADQSVVLAVPVVLCTSPPTLRHYKTDGYGGPDQDLANWYPSATMTQNCQLK